MSPAGKASSGWARRRRIDRAGRSRARVPYDSMRNERFDPLHRIGVGLKTRRLGHEPVSVRLKAETPVAFRLRRRQHDDRDVAQLVIALDFEQYFMAVGLRQT